MLHSPTYLNKYLDFGSASFGCIILLYASFCVKLMSLKHKQENIWGIKIKTSIITLEMKQEHAENILRLENCVLSKELKILSSLFPLGSDQNKAVLTSFQDLQRPVQENMVWHGDFPLLIQDEDINYFIMVTFSTSINVEIRDRISKLSENFNCDISGKHFSENCCSLFIVTRKNIVLWHFKFSLVVNLRNLSYARNEHT